jgi:NADH-quinone oxidoreductase subunit N
LEDFLKDFLLIMPEIFLALTLAFVVASEITYYGEQLRLVKLTSFLGLAAAFVQTVLSYRYGASQVFGGVLSIDGFSLFFKLLFIVLAMLNILSVTHTKEITEERRSEYCALILASTLAMCLVASSADLILAFLSLLFLNVISYFLAAYGQKSVLSTEAAVKYLAFGAVSSTLFLYAISILFASTHSLNIYEMHKALMLTPLSPKVMLIVFMLSFLALCFQIGAFPMYLLVPDVLEGSPTPVSGFLSVGTRAAGFAFATRFVTIVFTQPGTTQGQFKVLGEFDWTQVVAVISGLTMVIGALLSFRQKAAKRLVGYLVVAESGFLLLGLLVMDEVGVAALLYNLVIELFALMGTFYVLCFLYDELQSDRLLELRGMLKRAVPECICLVLFLLCLVGAPPFPGFIGKFTLIGAAIRHERIALAMVAIASMVICTVAVARLAHHLIGDFHNASEASPLAESLQRKLFLTALVLPMILIGVFADFVFSWAGQSLGFIFW